MEEAVVEQPREDLPCMGVVGALERPQELLYSVVLDLQGRLQVSYQVVAEDLQGTEEQAESA
jgi:hypothetical protein